MGAGGHENAPERSAAYRSRVTDPPRLAMMLVAFVAMFGYEMPATILPCIAGRRRPRCPDRPPHDRVRDPGRAVRPGDGAFTDLYGRRRVLVPSPVLFAAAGLATVAVADFAVLLVAR